MDLKLSIIVPMYNSEWCIADCIYSLYNQDLPLEQYEVIAVDNGSPDGCADYIRQMQQQYENLRLVSLPENCLPSGARNAGMDAAAGKYLIFVDSDDMLKPNVLRHLVNEIEKEDLDFVHFGFDIFNESKDVSIKVRPTTPVMDGVDLFVGDYISQDGKDVSWGKIYNREFLNKSHLRCTNGLLYEDDEFSYRVYAAARRVKHISYKPYLYRFNNMSATKNHNNISAIKSDLLEVQTLHQDIRDFKAKECDARFVEHLEKYMRWLISTIFDFYCQLEGSDKKLLRGEMQKILTQSRLPYMPKKRYVLFKLGIL